MESSTDVTILSAHRPPKATKYKLETGFGLKQHRLEYAVVMNYLSKDTCDIKTQMINLSESNPSA